MAMEYLRHPKLVEIVADYITGKDMHIDFRLRPVDLTVDTVPERKTTVSTVQKRSITDLTRECDLTGDSE